MAKRRSAFEASADRSRLPDSFDHRPWPIDGEVRQTVTSGCRKILDRRGAPAVEVAFSPKRRGNGAGRQDHRISEDQHPGSRLFLHVQTHRRSVARRSPAQNRTCGWLWTSRMPRLPYTAAHSSRIRACRCVWVPSVLPPDNMARSSPIWVSIRLFCDSKPSMAAAMISAFSFGVGM